MHICLFTPTFLPVVGGAELWCDTFARGMMARGHDVVVLAQRMRGHPLPPPLPYPVVNYRRPPLQHLCTEMLARPLVRLWRKHRFEIVVTVYGYPLAYAVSRVRARLGVGLIAVAQGADLYPNFNPKGKYRIGRLTALGYQRADHVIGVSQTMATRARHLMESVASPLPSTRALPPVQVIHNAANLGDWPARQRAAMNATSRMATQFGLTPRQFTLQVAGLRPVKRIDVALQAIALCRDLYERLNLRHVIAGTGKDPDRYHQLARDLHIADRVVFAGVRTGLDKDWLFAHARLLMHTSDEEGLPLVLSEAAASGLPILASDIEPHTDFMLDSSCGRIFHRGDPAHLAAVLRQMLGEDLTPMREAALARSRDFDTDAMVDAYEKVCQSVLAKTGRPLEPA